MRTVWLVALAAFLLDAGSGCLKSQEPECVCTQEFRFLIVNVRDGSGQPVTGVTITVTQVRTGAVIPVQQGNVGAGTYIILDDSFRSRISSSAETIRVAGQKGSTTFSRDYSVQTDSCGCHVSKVSGPDTITI